MNPIRQLLDTENLMMGKILNQIDFKDWYGQGVCACGTPLSYFLVGDIHDTLYHMQDNHSDHSRNRWQN